MALSTYYKLDFINSRSIFVHAPPAPLPGLESSLGSSILPVASLVTSVSSPDCGLICKIPLCPLLAQTAVLSRLFKAFASLSLEAWVPSIEALQDAFGQRGWLLASPLPVPLPW